MKIDGSTFLVTGGASGLGRATVERLLTHGGRVAILDLERSAGAEVAGELGPHALFAPCDVTSADGVAAAMDAAAKRFGSIHGLVNCAGVAIAEKAYGKRGPHDLGSFAFVVQVNLIGTFNCIRLAAARMAKNAPGEDGERGVIVNTASVAAFDGQIGQAAYSASKGGVVGMTLPIARDLAESASASARSRPGLFDTPMMAMLPEPARQSLGRAGAVPVAAGPARGVRGARVPHHRERHAERRDHPAGRRHPPRARANRRVTKIPRVGLPREVWALGFVSLFMDTSPSSCTASCPCSWRRRWAPRRS